MTDDKYFGHFLSKFPLTLRGAECSGEHLDRFRHRLPDSLLRYWREFGFSGFGDGLVWLTDPIEWESTTGFLTQGLDHPDLGSAAEYIPFARTAFGKVYFWTPGFGHSLVIEPMYGNAEYVRPPHADPSDDALRAFFSAATSESLQRIITPFGSDCQLFRPVYERIGHLSADRMYAFIPSLGVGGPPVPEATVAHVMHVHLEILKIFAGEWDTSGLNRGSELSRDFFRWLRAQPGDARVDLQAWLSTLPPDTPVVQLFADADDPPRSQDDATGRPRDEHLASARDIYDRLADALAQPSPEMSALYTDGLALAAAFVGHPELVRQLPADAPHLMTSALEQAGEAGIADAPLQLGSLLLRGGSWQSPALAEDRSKAIELFRQADALGAADANFHFADAVYATRDQNLATEAWTRIAAFSASNPEHPAALVLLGYMLQSGFGVTANTVSAGEKFARAAELGSHDGAFELAVRALGGVGRDQSDDEGIAWTFRAAELGNNRAKYNLGAFYATGTRGLPRDAGRAFVWYSEAADGGHATAAFTAAVMLLRNEGGLEQAPERTRSLLATAEDAWGPAEVSARLARLGLNDL